MAGDVEAAYSRDRVAKAIIRSTKNAERESFLAYMVPALAAADGEGGAADAAEGGEEMEWVRDYCFDARKDYVPEANSYFLAVGDDSVVYNGLDARVNLTRGSFQPRHRRPSRITLTRRTRDAAEEAQLAERRQQLLAITDASRAAPLALTDKSRAEGGGGDDDDEPVIQDAEPAAVEESAGDGGAGGDGDDDDDDEGGDTLMVEDDDDD